MEKNVSVNLVRALQYAARGGASILGIVGRDGGFTAQVADACVIVPVVNPRISRPIRGLSGGRMAFARVSPGIEGRPNEMGKGRNNPYFERAVFLDRDGGAGAAPLVKEGKPFPAHSMADFELLPGVSEAASVSKPRIGSWSLQHQPTRCGALNPRARVVEEMHRKLQSLLPLDRIEVSYDSGHVKRLLLRIASQLQGCCFVPHRK